MARLFHDDIAEIIRSLPAGSVIAVSDIRTVRVSCSPVDYDGIVAADRCYLDSRSRPGSKWFVPPHILLDEIYDAIDSGETVTVNNRNILEM